MEVFNQKSINNLPIIPVKIKQGPYAYYWADLNYGLRFYTQNVKNAIDWPTSTVVLKRIKEKQVQHRL